MGPDDVRWQHVCASNQSYWEKNGCTVSYEINVASFIMGLEVRPAFFGMEGGSPIDKSCLLDQGSTLITNSMSPRVVIKLNKEKENCMY